MRKQCIVVVCMLLFANAYGHNSKVGIPALPKESHFQSQMDDGDVTDAEATAFITDMYNNKMYENLDFLRVHCTPKLLKKLWSDFGEQYDYEGLPAEECLAVWDFRSGAQDDATERLHRVISVSPQGNGYYKYFFFDGGIRGANKLKLCKVNGNILMDDVIEMDGGANPAIHSRMLTPSDLLQMDALNNDSLDNFLYYHGYQCINKPYQGEKTESWTLDCYVNYEFDEEWSENVPWSITAGDKGPKASSVEYTPNGGNNTKLSLMIFSDQGLKNWKTELSAMGYKFYTRESGERYSGEYWVSDKGDGYFQIDNGFTFHRLSYLSNAKVLGAELEEVKQKLLGDPYKYCEDEDESYNHAMLKIDKRTLAECLKNTAASRVPFESTELRTKVWLMEDGGLSVDRERYSSLSGKDQNLLAMLLRAIQQGSHPKPASLVSQRTYPSLQYAVPEAFDLSASISEGQEQSTGCTMKMVKGAANTWTIENKEELYGKGFTDEVLEQLVRTSPELQHSKKKKMKMDINSKPLVVSLNINWPSNRKAEEADNFFADDLQIPSYFLSKHTGVLGVLGGIAVGTLNVLSR